MSSYRKSSKRRKIPDPNTIEVKSKFYAEFRRFSVNRLKLNKFLDFRDLVLKSFRLSSIPFTICYTDPLHGDLLPINNDENFAKALSSVVSHNALLRIILQRLEEDPGQIIGYGNPPNANKKKNRLSQYLLNVPSYLSEKNGAPFCGSPLHHHQNHHALPNAYNNGGDAYQQHGSVVVYNGGVPPSGDNGSLPKNGAQSNKTHQQNSHNPGIPTPVTSNATIVNHSILTPLKESLDRLSDPHYNENGHHHIPAFPNQRPLIGKPLDFRTVSSIIDVDLVPETQRRVRLVKPKKPLKKDGVNKEFNEPDTHFYFDDRPLGFYIRQGWACQISSSGLTRLATIYVSRLVPGGIAAATGLLAVGDQILEVNGVPTDGKSLDQVTDMMVANASDLVLTVKPADQSSTLVKARGLPKGYNGSISEKENCGAYKTSEERREERSRSNWAEKNGTPLVEAKQRETFSGNSGNRRDANIEDRRRSNLGKIGWKDDLRPSNNHANQNMECKEEKRISPQNNLDPEQIKKAAPAKLKAVAPSPQHEDSKRDDYYLALNGSPPPIPPRPSLLLRQRRPHNTNQTHVPVSRSPQRIDQKGDFEAALPTPPPRKKANDFAGLKISDAGLNDSSKFPETGKISKHLFRDPGSPNLAKNVPNRTVDDFYGPADKNGHRLVARNDSPASLADSTRDKGPRSIDLTAINQNDRYFAESLFDASPIFGNDKKPPPSLLHSTLNLGKSFYEDVMDHLSQSEEEEDDDDVMIYDVTNQNVDHDNLNHGDKSNSVTSDIHSAKRISPLVVKHGGYTAENGKTKLSAEYGGGVVIRGDNSAKNNQNSQPGQHHYKKRATYYDDYVAFSHQENSNISDIDTFLKSAIRLSAVRGMGTNDPKKLSAISNIFSPSHTNSINPSLLFSPPVRTSAKKRAPKPPMLCSKI
ncbi:unnamed protein product [Gordionus sp. m RMFG-2023]|uniref:uncharacterized protein LOC135925289 isoform X2 n=1 Tax=Gordionus sp. m RMFG-2023 TaxID=3053472 RepID=UPI0030E111B7